MPSVTGHKYILVYNLTNPLNIDDGAITIYHHTYFYYIHIYTLYTYIYYIDLIKRKKNKKEKKERNVLGLDTEEHFLENGLQNAPSAMVTDGLNLLPRTLHQCPYFHGNIIKRCTATIITTPAGSEHALCSHIIFTLCRENEFIIIYTAYIHLTAFSKYNINLFGRNDPQMRNNEAKVSS